MADEREAAWVSLPFASPIKTSGHAVSAREAGTDIGVPRDGHTGRHQRQTSPANTQTLLSSHPPPPPPPPPPPGTVERQFTRILQLQHQLEATQLQVLEQRSEHVRVQAVQAAKLSEAQHLVAQLQAKVRQCRAKTNDATAVASLTGPAESSSSPSIEANALIRKLQAEVRRARAEAQNMSSLAQEKEDEARQATERARRRIAAAKQVLGVRKRELKGMLATVDRKERRIARVVQEARAREGVWRSRANRAMQTARDSALQVTRLQKQLQAATKRATAGEHLESKVASVLGSRDLSIAQLQGTVDILTRERDRWRHNAEEAFQQHAQLQREAQQWKAQHEASARREADGDAQQARHVVEWKQQVRQANAMVKSWQHKYQSVQTARDDDRRRHDEQVAQLQAQLQTQQEALTQALADVEDVRVAWRASATAEVGGTAPTTRDNGSNDLRGGESVHEAQLAELRGKLEESERARRSLKAQLVEERELSMRLQHEFAKTLQASGGGETKTVAQPANSDVDGGLHGDRGVSEGEAASGGNTDGDEAEGSVTDDGGDRERRPADTGDGSVVATGEPPGVMMALVRLTKASTGLVSIVEDVLAGEAVTVDELLSGADGGAGVAGGQSPLPAPVVVVAQAHRAEERVRLCRHGLVDKYAEIVGGGCSVQ